MIDITCLPYQSLAVLFSYKMVFSSSKGKVAYIFWLNLLTAITKVIFCCCFCSFAQLWLTLCNPTDCNTPGFPVLHHLMELAQTHVHWISNAIQPSLLSPRFWEALLNVFMLVSREITMWPQLTQRWISGPWGVITQMSMQVAW